MRPGRFERMEKAKPTPDSKGTRPLGAKRLPCDEPMTGAQALYLGLLCEQAGEPEKPTAGLTKAEAAQRIDALRARVLPGVSHGAT